MAKFQTKPLEFEAKDAQEAGMIVAAVKIMLEKVQPADLVKLATAVNKNPGLVKTALKFI